MLKLIIKHEQGGKGMDMIVKDNTKSKSIHLEIMRIITGEVDGAKLTLFHSSFAVVNCVKKSFCQWGLVRLAYVCYIFGFWRIEYLLLC